MLDRAGRCPQRCFSKIGALPTRLPHPPKKRKCPRLLILHLELLK